MTQVRFDDRLTTVLDQPAASAHDRAVRWRQLVELVARTPGDSQSSLVDRALAEIRNERDSIEERLRVAAALAVASLPLPVGLVAAFAADQLRVAAPILAGARLTATEWRHVAGLASDDCRAFISAMRSEESNAAPSEVQGLPAEAPIPSISEVVARIERLRSSREAQPPGSPAEPAEPSRLFRWECNEAGAIEWVDGAPRGALVGRSIAQGDSGSGIDRRVERAFAARAPFHDGLLELPRDAIAGGTWKISGIPAFERSTGRFAGYRGVAQRPDGDVTATDPTSLRELVHEIRTPLNAIIGFAEMIIGEYLGPAESAYRDRAKEIVAQAQLLLRAIEDLDFAAKIQHSARLDHPRINLGELMEQMIGRLREQASGRDVTLEASRSTADLAVSVDRTVAERLIERMIMAVIGRAAKGETLRLGVDQEGARCTVWISRPAALAGLRDEQLFGSPEDTMSKEFPLRLARGLAHSAGVEMIVSPSAICLAFPRD